MPSSSQIEEKPPDLVGDDIHVEFDLEEEREACTMGDCVAFPPVHTLPPSSELFDAGPSEAVFQEGDELIDTISTLKSDGYLSPISDGTIYDVFDSQSILGDEDADLLGLVSDEGNHTKFDGLDRKSSSEPDYVAGNQPSSSLSDDLGLFNPQLAVAAKYWPEGYLTSHQYSPSLCRSVHTMGRLLFYLTSSVLNINLGHPLDTPAIEPLTSVIPSTDEYQELLPSPKLDSAEPMLDEENHFKGVELSSFLPDLRSLDSSLPSSPRLEWPYTLSQVFTDSSVLSGGSLGLSVSPDLSLIQTPMTGPFHDNIIIASPSLSYLSRSQFEADQVVPRKVSEDHKALQPPGSSNRRPKIEVTIPSLPSLLYDEHLSTLMSTVELARARSYDTRSSIPELFPLPLPHSAMWTSNEAQHDRSIWPTSSTTDRYLPSPHMRRDSVKTSPKRRRANSAASTPQVVTRSKSAGTISEHPTEAVGVFAIDAGSSKQLFQRQILQGNSLQQPWHKVSEYIRTILTPIEAEGGEENGHEP